MISLAQVVAALGVGAMLPITALLAVEMHRLRQRKSVDDQVAEPPTPERVVDDDRIEAIAQLAARRFELRTEEQPGGCTAEDPTGVRSKEHLTLITRPLRHGRKRSLTGAAAETRRPSTHRPAETAARAPGRITRD